MKKTMIALVLAASSIVSAQAADIARGKQLVDTKGCAACHGADLNSPTAPNYPRLAGQHKDYLEHALKAYKRGTKVLNGRANPTMGGMAAQLTDDEIPDVAAYIASLKGSLVLEK